MRVIDGLRIIFDPNALEATEVDAFGFFDLYPSANGRLRNIFA